MRVCSFQAAKTQRVPLSQSFSCSNCKKSFGQTKILRHISNRKTCKGFYGTRLDDLKRQNESKTTNEK